MKSAGRRVFLAISSAVLLCVALAGAVRAQTGWVSPVADAFGLGFEPLGSAPAFADIDDDGDLDFFLGGFGGFTRFQENTGTANAPAFASFVSNPFGLTSIGAENIPTFADIDGDGDLDALMGEAAGDVWLFENTGTASAPAFDPPVTNPFGLADVGGFSGPAFGDLDADGDLDALVGNSAGDLTYFQNLGTTTAPSFGTAVVNPFGLTGTGGLATANIVDVDGDGDLDVFANGGRKDYFENTGSPSVPAFAAPRTDPFGLTNVGAGEVLAFADIDGDGDLDVFDGTGSAMFWFPRRGCPFFPSTTCASGFERKSLTVRETNLSRRSLTLKLAGGPALEQADFGDPTASGGTTYHLCIYDDADVLWVALEVARAGDVCPTEPCWKSVPSIQRDYRYRDVEAAAAGVTAIRLQEGDAGTSRISVKGRSNSRRDQRALPIFIAESLASAASVQVRLHGSDAPECFADTLTPSIQTPAVLVAR